MRTYIPVLVLDQVQELLVLELLVLEFSHEVLHAPSTTSTQLVNGLPVGLLSVPLSYVH